MRFVRTAENLFGLPQGFTRVEYLQSTGTQYIDTGVNTDSDLGFYVSFKWDTFNTANSRFLGVIKQDGSSYLRHHSSDSGSSFSYFVSNDGTTIQGTATTAFHSFSYNSVTKKFNFDGTEISAVSPATFDTGLNFWLFGRNSNTESLKSYASVKIYSARLYNNDTLVRDFIPVLDNSGRPAMYDQVSGQLFYNQGSGDDFSYGRQIIPVEYLESTGTQYIDTNTEITPTTTILIDASLESYSQWSNSCGGVPSARGYFCLPFGWAGSNTTARSIYGTDTAGTGEYNFNYTLGQRIRLLYNDNKKLYIDDTHVFTFNYDKETPPSTQIFQFGRYSNACGAKFYGVKIWDNGYNSTPVADFIPCKDENNVGFMFDNVSGTCYLNAGTGSFTVGENKYTSKLRLIRNAIRIPDGYTRVEYLESTGTQYINTGIKLDNNSSVELDYQLTQAVQNRKGLFGALNLTGSNQGRFGSLLSPSNQQLEHGYGSGNDYWQQGLPDTNIHKLYQKKNEVYFDGTLIHTFNSATFSLAVNAYLGNFVYTNYTPASAKYYRSKWWDNGTLVRSFIPVRDENNTGYMFDEVTGQLFGNAGSGSFGIGNDLKKPKVRFIQDVLPREYRPLKYLESTGTQFILIGFTPTVNTDFELELSSTKTSTKWAMGCPTWVGVHYNGVDGQIGITNSSTSDFQQYVNYARDNTRITMKLQGNTVYANGVSLGTITRRAGTLDFALFGYRDANRGATLFFNGSVYKCTIWDNGVPVRDFYPALRKSDNKPGMYDRITKQFFTNNATSGNDFNYG